MVCPDCKGLKTTIVSFVRNASGNCLHNVPAKCLRCQGTGEVDDRMAKWIEVGSEMREHRIRGGRYRSLHQEAKRRGMSAMLLSMMEQGYIEPIPEKEGAK